MERTPGDYNSEGAAGNRTGFNSDLYGAGPLRFFEAPRGLRDEGSLAGIALG